MNIKQRITFIFAIFTVAALLSGFSSADDGVSTQRITTGDFKADVKILQGAVESAAARGEIRDEATARNLQLQLTTIDFYLDQENTDKALQQLRQYEVLVEHHQYSENIERTRGIMIRKITTVLAWDWQTILENQ